MLKIDQQNFIVRIGTEKQGTSNTHISTGKCGVAIEESFIEVMKETFFEIMKETFIKVMKEAFIVEVMKSTFIDLSAGVSVCVMSWSSSLEFHSNANSDILMHIQEPFLTSNRI